MNVHLVFGMMCISSQVERYGLGLHFGKLWLDQPLSILVYVVLAES